MFVKLSAIILLFFFVNGHENLPNKSNIASDGGEISTKSAQPRRLIKFEDQFDSDHVSFDDQNVELSNTKPVEFEIGPELSNLDGYPNRKPVTFEVGQESNNIDSYPNDGIGAVKVKFDNTGQDIAENGSNDLLSNGLQPGKGKKKRRRRKPRQRFPNHPNFWNSQYPGPNRPMPGFDQNFGLVPGPFQSFGAASKPIHTFGLPPGSGQNFGPNPFQMEFNTQLYRRPRRPQPSLASDALKAVTGALTSIAHNDDYQCVARLLCEAAAGGALGGSSLLESVSGLQPLLTLLSAYNGVSSNPLFVFGRAAFLGMSSKSNPGSCRYAYSLCPTDPEQLVHYLNNHNGGFFRFFNAPQHGPQSIEQFYNQLSQNYGMHQPNPGNNQEFYGLLNPGSYQHPAEEGNLYPNNGYGYQQNYGLAYPYNQNHNNGNGIRFKNYEGFNDEVRSERVTNDNKIEKRIQNKPNTFLNDYTSNSKWLFPVDDDVDIDESDIGVQYINNDDFGYTDARKGKNLKFPDGDSTSSNDNILKYNKEFNFYITETERTPKAIYFPETQKKIDDNTNKYYRPVYSNSVHYLLNSGDKEIDDHFGGVGNNHNSYKNDEDEPGITTVYVVRGNNDPSKPEIIKLRPGQTL